MLFTFQHRLSDLPDNRLDFSGEEFNFIVDDASKGIGAMFMLIENGRVVAYGKLVYGVKVIGLNFLELLHSSIQECL